MIQQTRSAHPTSNKMFEGRKIVVASTQGKHLVMKPLLKQYLNLNTVVVPEDTDESCAFSDEIERPFNSVARLHKKILKSLKASGETLGIGSEGTFGPHPHIPFLNADREIVMFIDLKHDTMIMESVISTDTMHKQKEITCMKDLHAFTEKIQFPTHGINLRQLKNGKEVSVRKGILTWELLYPMSLHYMSPETQLIAETDMRGYMNPTRMKVIERATKLLMKKIIKLCPECRLPGLGVVEIESALYCGQSSEATKPILLKVRQCNHCSYKEEPYHQDGQNSDSPIR